jgi:nicotinamidase-related amidase
MLLEAAKTTLLIVDVQERLLPVVQEPARVLARNLILLEAAEVLDIPVTISEQYPKGLGPTAPALRSNTAAVFEKTTFSCWRDQAMRAHFIQHHERERPLIIVTGLEAHVCVLQTCIDLSTAGFGVFAVADAISSRHAESAALAFDRLRGAGIQLINTEMAVFELMEKAGTPEFKTLSSLIK